MIAKVSEAYLKDNMAEAFTKMFQEHQNSAPTEAREGHHGTYLLINEEKKEVMALSLWQTKEAMNKASNSTWNLVLRNKAKEFFIAAPTHHSYTVKAAPELIKKNSRRKKMAKTLHCNDLGFDCGFVAQAETEQDLLGQVANHASEAHGITEITPELLEQVKGVVKED